MSHDVDAVCSYLCVVVTVGPTDAGEDGIRVAKNYVAGKIELKTSALIRT
jgi:hypothetical protein